MSSAGCFRISFALEVMQDISHKQSCRGGILCACFACAGHTAAMSFLEKIHASPRILKIYSNEEIESDAKDILMKYADQDFSYTDAISFAIMSMQRIEKVFCFDKHFLTAGFVRIP